MDYLYLEVVFASIREGIRIIASRSPVIDTKGLQKILDTRLQQQDQKLEGYLQRHSFRRPTIRS